ncbi:MAG: hypothetical protein ROW52_14780 [Anaerolineaceae bacterium]
MRSVPEQLPSLHPRKRPNRSFPVLLLVLGLFWLSLSGWLRFQQSLALWDVLVRIEISPGPLYLAISGVAWGMLGLAGGLGVFFIKPWAVRWTNALVLFLATWFWLDRLVWVRSEAAQVNNLFMAFMTVAALVYTYVVTRKMARTLIPVQKAHEAVHNESNSPQ